VRREQGRADFIVRVTANIQRNRENLEKAHEALARTRQRVERLHEKLSEPSSAKWQAIHDFWLHEAETKAASIMASISRLESWIAEDEERLR
jgi:dsDNA-specific endonuclease/ATPase MutS2